MKNHEENFLECNSEEIKPPKNPEL